ncbi:uncharacterized protein LOC141629892 [Silene latifolia]|uniref:uncharacterized protein LOC141629892 n=1 Tax=Silene latifolia TaxID=37657 RepID=UPI003D7780D2
MVGIDPSVISHKLSVNPGCTPVQQKRRKFAAERNEVINKEVDSLLAAGKIREVSYPEWLSNVVVVPKKNGKWRVCVDFTDLNKACPKDPFPLPHIDAMVDATAGHEVLTFLDAWSGYNQIKMHPQDQEKTAFMSERGKTIEVYIDDMVVKSKKAEMHMEHLADTFQTLREFKMKLNPSKCSFGVSSGKFLGYMVTQRGIEASKEQIKAILQLESPQKPKDVQRLAGKVAALNRFISRASDWCKLFFDILRKSQKFKWTEKHEKAFAELKSYLSTPPLLAKPEQGEPLFLYLSVTEAAVSAVLVKEQEGVQHPVYYISKSLLPAETRYTSFEKLALALVTASYKLRPYFESHTIHVITNYPLKTIMRKPELSGRMTKWSVHLSGYDLQFEPRTAIKSQALADFVSDFCPATRGEAEEGMLTITGSQDSEIWTLYIDGASNARGTGVGLVLRSPKGDMIVQAVRCEFKATNNEAEYEALILGMQMASGLKVRNLRVYSDSLLVVNHVNNEYVARDSKMIAYLKVATEQKSKFRTFKISQVPRDQNVEADALATLGATFQPTKLSNIPITHMLTPTIQKEPDQNPVKEDVHMQCTQGARTLVSTVGQQDADWRVPYLNWLRDGTLPEDRKEAQSFRIKASRYIMIDKILFTKSLAGPCLRCLSKEEAETVPQDVHGRECGNHAGGRSLSNKILRQGYFWPTMGADAWIETEAMTEVKERQVISFIKRNIISRFGIPSEIICDNGSQFISDNTEGFCARWNITLRKYGCQTAEQNKVEMARSLDTIDELRESAYIRMASYKQSVARTSNKNVKIRTLEVGYLVLRRVFKNTKNHKAGKFAYKWEGPYQVESIFKNGAYRAKGARTEFQTSGTTRNATFLVSQKQSMKKPITRGKGCAPRVRSASQVFLCGITAPEINGKKHKYNKRRAQNLDPGLL